MQHLFRYFKEVLIATVYSLHLEAWNIKRQLSITAKTTDFNEMSKPMPKNSRS